MAVKNVTVQDVVIKRKGIAFLCAASATLNMTKEALDAVCAGTGAWSEFSQGRKSWSMSMDALMRLFTASDIASNYSFNDAFADFDDDEYVDVEWQIGNADNGGYRYFGKVFHTDLSFSWSASDTSTFSESLQGTGPVTRAAVVPVTPAAPTEGVVDDVNNTFDWTNSAGYEDITDMEQTLDGGSTVTDLSAKPIVVPGAKAAGQVGVRVKAADGNPASNWLFNAAPFTV